MLWYLYLLLVICVDMLKSSVFENKIFILGSVFNNCMSYTLNIEQLSLRALTTISPSNGNENEIQE